MSDFLFFKKILSKSRLKFNEAILKRAVLQDPNSKNFLGIISILNKYRIISKPCFYEKKDFPSKEIPFITHKSNPDEIVYIEKQEGNILYYTNNDGFNMKSSVEDFMVNWSRNIIFLDFSEAKEQNFYINYLKCNFKIFSLLITSLITIYLLFNLFLLPFNIFYIINNFVGLFICNKLHNINLTQNQEQSKICSLSKKTNCLNVLNHKNSKLFGLISYEKIGLIYFIFALLSPIFILNNTVLYYLFFLSALFPIYSIYFQYFVAKSWCPLCLIIQVNLIINFLLFLIFGFDLNLSFIAVLNSIILFVFVVYFVEFFMKRYEYETKMNSLIIKTNSFINDDEVFNLIQNRNITLIKVPKQASVFSGNLEASNKITFITNPFCKYCSERYNQIIEVIEYNQNIKVETIFCITNDLEIISTVSKVLLFIYLAEGKVSYEKASKDWYLSGINDYDGWLKKYKTNSENYDSLIDEILIVHNEWCKLSKISATPTVLFNDIELSNYYNVLDLKFKS